MAAPNSKDMPTVSLGMTIFYILSSSVYVGIRDQTATEAELGSTLSWFRANLGGNLRMEFLWRENPNGPSPQPIQEKNFLREKWKTKFDKQNAHKHKE
ncbi:hypothetical protein HGM15179_007669 [Zosterops borbonicus]|uniref:Uncharacterized protein n=1 Tax=Zosterops borbonicus TaxID=364589 RepID=A0A8K1LMH8_9PASS|nr:hypothetical protein HGM15179_007669 [Zosterops borbonicus]